MMKFIVKKLFRISVQGIENYRAAGDRVLIVANHLSFLDGILLAIFLPEVPLFAINDLVAQRWFIKPLLKTKKLIPLDPNKPLAVKSIIEKIRNNHKCAIFPEGRITVTGSLMKIYEGPGLIATKSEAMILPIRIDGAQYSIFSRLQGKVKLRLFPKISIIILEPRKLKIPDSVSNRDKRLYAADKLYTLMSEMLFLSSSYQTTLWNSLLEQQKLTGRQQIILEDSSRNTMNIKSFIVKAKILARIITKNSANDEIIGLLVPNSIAAAVTFFAMQSANRVPAMLNYSSGANDLLSACKIAKIRQIITSKAFIDTAKYHATITKLEQDGIKVFYLEELKQEITKADMLVGLTSKNFKMKKSSKAPAVVLFTSGSEGVPKGVVLSHENLQANIYQLASRIDFGPTDIIFNALPIFHAFGLTAGFLLPILSGIRTFLYPSPLHYRIVPELVYDSNATIMFGTDTFLAGYAKYANPYDFYSIRYIFAGAEKLKPETQRLWADRFGVRLLEGYGATETAPVLTVNTPMHNNIGTVGRFVPGVNYRLEHVPGINEGGRLFVKGPNVMLGYLLAEQPGKIQLLDNGEYDTGDIVSLDEKGYVSIIGRAKRFAKIAGEMVSLAAVEAHITKIYPQNIHAVIAVADAKKGEALVCFSENFELTRLMLVKKSFGVNELYIPRYYVCLDSMPMLASGKIDYMQLKKIYT